MTIRKVFIMAALAAAGLLAGCASEGNVLSGNLTTASVGNATPGAAPRVDPECVTLTAKIDALRKEGFAERVEQASTGKTKTVSVKRESLAKMTELDKANTEFQAKCSTLTPKPAQSAALVAPAAAPAAPAPAAKP